MSGEPGPAVDRPGLPGQSGRGLSASGRSLDEGGLAENEQNHDLVALRDALDAVVRSLGRGVGGGRRGGGAGTVSVFRSWDEAVGPTVAEHARPIALDDGRLLVEVDQPGWATQLRYLSGTVLERLSDAIGPGIVRSLEVRVARR